MGSQSKPILRILLIEDNPDDELLILRTLRRANGFDLVTKTVNSESALLIALNESLDWDIVLCDYILPTLSPFKALEIVKSARYELPLIVISGSVKEDVAVEILKAGASDFISKDHPERIPLAIRRELRRAGEKIQSKLDLERGRDQTIEAWGKALELRDVQTQGHTMRVTDLTLRLAHHLGVSKEQFNNIRRGALLHDIGKIQIPDMILLKEGPLDPPERKIMESHPKIARDLLLGISYLEEAINIPYCHHEKWDGSGYPRGIKGEEIPFEARIFSIVDIYDALRSDRPYRKRWSLDRTIEYINEESGKIFDPALLPKFLEII